MSRGLGNEQKVLGLLGWGWWGDSRGRRAWGLAVTSVLPQLPAISKTCVNPKGVFCVHFSIFQVDRPARPASEGGWEHSRGPREPAAWGPPAGSCGGQGSTDAWDRGVSLGTCGRGGFRIDCWGGNSSAPSSQVLEHYSPLRKGTMGLTTCHWS